ncbi:acyltransferase family protein [Rheinheimera sp.]|uniref:acyltransferase family protein n=1 Tax=Rheinheimera sp. TaxID=1869214 RepID=UPI004047507C
MSTNNYRPDVQGLRAVAVLAVILFHFNPEWLPGGFVGVDVFLVISGYLIASILLNKKTQPDYQLVNTVREFYVSRFKRIAPVYFVMLVMVSLLVAVLFIPQDLSIYKKSLNQAAIFNSNHYFAGFGDYFAPANHEQPLLHTWSLAVEIQFYLLAPLFILLLPNKVLPWSLATLLVGFTAVAEYRLRILGLQQETYYSLYARLPAFFAGTLVALWIRNLKCGGQTWLGTMGLGVVLVSAAVQPLLGPFPGVLALLPVAGAVLVLLRPAQGFTGKLLASKPMVWVGVLSYSLYIWHWPVLALLRYYTGSPVLDMAHSLLFVVITVFLATLSYYYVEIPMRTHRARIKQFMSYGLLLGAVLATGPAMPSINQALSPSALPIEYQRYADPATICHGQIVGDCLKGDLRSDMEVLVLGDSHAAMLNHFFNHLGKELGFKARIITASSCLNIPGFDHQRIDEWSREACQKQIEHSKKYLFGAKTIFLAASWNWHLASDDFQRALEAFLIVQTQTGAKVFIMEQEPLLNKNPLRILRFSALGLTPRIGIDPAYHQANVTLQHLAARHPSVSSLNFEATGVFANVPFVDSHLIYFDEHHLNEVGAKRYAAAVSSAFQKIVNGGFKYEVQ